MKQNTSTDHKVSIINAIGELIDEARFAATRRLTESQRIAWAQILLEAIKLEVGLSNDWLKGFKVIHPPVLTATAEE